MTLMARNPFSRTELHRERVFTSTDSCSFCGERSENAHGQPFLYAYFIEGDTGRRMPISGLFCGADCFESYR